MKSHQGKPVVFVNGHATTMAYGEGIIASTVPPEQLASPGEIPVSISCGENEATELGKILLSAD